ncbi:hypothetical protein B0H17DRAFT_1086583 [Mycena rosella]|uniref:Uncharacterized protein n=1 Tax=Mycena rosella TaxID=1033263 RepID=A0AAD7D1U4_MYCRO|nr:hypothetical protein B0H17DRAFT_1086583 [Mycena rosella]
MMQGWSRDYLVCLECTCKGWDWANLVGVMAAVTCGICDSGYTDGSSGPAAVAGQNQ